MLDQVMTDGMTMSGMRE